MEFLRTSIQYLTFAVLLLAAAQIYLTLNKIWIRKHEPAVADSISIMGETLGLVPLVVLTTHFMLEGAWEGVLDGALWLVAGLVTIAIGTGRWVEGRRSRSFWTLLREALSLERDEVGDLARAFFRPTSARKILDILGQIALIDDELDDRERQFIESFAESWGVEVSWQELVRSRSGGRVDYLNLRASLEDYLATSPPPNQASQLGDVISALVQIDEEVSSQEDLVVSELLGMIESYVERDAGSGGYGVAIVPQDPEQDEAIAALLPDVRKQELEGGSAYVVGPFYDDGYADIVGGEYRALNFFATVVRLPSRGPEEVT